MNYKFKIGDKVWYPDYPLGQYGAPGEKRFMGIIEGIWNAGSQIFYDIDTENCFWASKQEHLVLYKLIDCPEYLRN